METESYVILVVPGRHTAETTLMRSSWYYSLWMLVTYVSVFVIWKVLPSRLSFVAVGLAAIVFLLVGLLRARKAGYFANRVDLAVHAWVIADLVFETFAFEIFRLFQLPAVRPMLDVGAFHDNTNFFGCTLAFTLLIGANRWYATRKTRIADGTAYGQAGV